MSVSISTIKKEAKSTLTGKWVLSVIASLTLLFLYIIIQNTAYLLGTVLGEAAAVVLLIALTVFVFCPLLLGVIRYFWHIFLKQPKPPISVFYYFSRLKLYKKAISVAVKIALRVLLFGLLFYLPAIAVYVISNPNFYRFIDTPIPIWSQNLSYLVNFLSSLASALIAVSTIKFYLAPILVIANENIDIEEAFHMSGVISRSSLLDFAFLLFSFIGWAIFSLLFIPLIFTLPYFIMCYVVHSFYSIKAYNEKIKSLNDQQSPFYVAGV